MIWVRLQGTLTRDFWFKVVWPNRSISAPDKRPKIFSILVSGIAEIFHFSCMPRILSIPIDSFHIPVFSFSVYVQIHILS